MKTEDAKVAIREAKSRQGVYDALEKMGVTVCSTYNLHYHIKRARENYQPLHIEAMRVALNRINEIDNKEV